MRSETTSFFAVYYAASSLEVVGRTDVPVAEGTHVSYKERISKKRTKNEAKTTKPDTEWKSMIKTKSRQSPSLKKSTKVNPDKSKVKK
ncbi:hypothetical protein Tco_0693458 [Tanacetum coccineum]